jgi:predicted DsbA family dithiol-disulfide isomerase
MRTLTIDVVSDVMCPWCFIGARRLDAALAPLPDVKATIRHVPFLLDPSTPEGGADLRERLRTKYRADPERMFAQVEAAAKSSGIPLDFAKVRRSFPTVAAHTLLRHAAAKGTQHALLDALYAAYFLEGRDVGDGAVLAEIASAHGFTAEEATRLIADPAELAATRDEVAGVAEQGVTGVPFFIFDERFAASGAQPVEVMRGAIERCLAEGA